MEKQTKNKKNIAEPSCDDPHCPFHGKLSARGRTFQGVVIKKFPKRLTIQFERTIYLKKYERYMKKKSKLHARISKCMEDKIDLGDYIQIQECRPLSKIIHFVVIKLIRKKEEKGK
ncbi:MAG: 30S ribosomal protein S17 [Nanoarchaeota archaeon]|nr:30S ribosomal protein S17 [Nanoarchaeota archaeon]